MKQHESLETARRFSRVNPVACRIDGKRFSKFTQGLARPFDPRLSSLMIDTTRFLMDQAGAHVGYTQSDEITLLFYSESPDVQLYLDAKIQKLTSVLASMTTSYFVRHLDEALPEKAGQMPMFDCRCWEVPSLAEASNVILWRTFDAIRNSVSMAAQAHFSHKSLQHKNVDQMKEMLAASGVVWSEYPSLFKWGTLLRRHVLKRRLSAQELADLPPKHHAHQNPDLEFERTAIVACEHGLHQVDERVDYLFSSQAAEG